MRLGMGLALTQPRRVIGWSGPGVPPDSFGSLGDVVYDVTGGLWYEKRWVGNREGVDDGILFPVNLFPSVGNFDFECMVRRDNLLDNRVHLVASSEPDNLSVQMTIPAASDYHWARLFDSSSTQKALLSSTGTDTKWHKLGARRVGNILTTLVDGVVTATADYSGWSPSLTQINTRILVASAGGTTSIKACNFRLTAPGGTITAALNEGAGTVITNTTGPNGTLTDAAPTNFWYQAWVPTEPALDFRIPENSQYLALIMEDF